MIAALGGAWQCRLNPDMLAKAVLQACGPLSCVHFSLAPLHTPLPMLLIPVPPSTVCIAATVAHGALSMLQIVLPSSCTAVSRHAVCVVTGQELYNRACCAVDT